MQLRAYLPSTQQLGSDPVLGDEAMQTALSRLQQLGRPVVAHALHAPFFKTMPASERLSETQAPAPLLRTLYLQRMAFSLQAMVSLSFFF